MAKKPAQDKVFTGEGCPVCSRSMGKSIGPRNAVAIVVTDEPEFSSVGMSYPMDILRAELSRVGMDLYGLRVTSLCKHAWEQDCINEHSRMLWEEMDGIKIVFALGGQIVKLLTGKPSPDMNGIVTTSELTPGKVIVCGMNPAVAWHGMVGELRLACKAFAEEYFKEDIWTS